MPKTDQTSLKTLSKSKKADLLLHRIIEERAKELPAKAVLTPNLPIGVFLQEAYNIYRFMQDDRELFIAGNFDWAVAEELPELIGFLRDTEAALWAMKYGLSPIEKAYRDMRETTVNTYDRLLRDLSFACRNDNDSQRIIKRSIVIKDNQQSSFHQNLANLASFAKDHTERLRQIGSDISLIDDMRRFSSKLPKLFAQFKHLKFVKKEQFDMRNRVYTLLAGVLEEIRVCARYVLADDKKRLKGYASEYFRKSSRTGKKKDEETE